MNTATIKLVKEFESLHDGDLSTIGLQTKMDPIGIWTEGYGRAMIDPKTKGHLRGASNKKRALQLTTITTEAQANKALTEDLWRLGVLPVIREIKQENWDRLNPNQQGALASFCYNCGTGYPVKYRIWVNVVKYLNGTMTASQFATYWENSVIKGGGKVLNGLVRRRKAEVVLFFL